MGSSVSPKDEIWSVRVPSHFKRSLPYDIDYVVTLEGTLMSEDNKVDLEDHGVLEYTGFNQHR